MKITLQIELVQAPLDIRYVVMYDSSQPEPFRLVDTQCDRMTLSNGETFAVEWVWRL